LGIPCLTVRDSTERPITVSEGTNGLVGINPNGIRRAASDILTGRAKRGRVPHLWDGHAAERIAQTLVRSPFRTHPLLAHLQDYPPAFAI